MAYPLERLVEIDPRQMPKDYMNTLVHELIHLAFPKLSETEVIRSANLIAGQLWKEKYRKVSQ